MAMTAAKRRLALFGMALAMAGLAGFLVKFYLDRKTAELESRYANTGEKTRIVVPKRNLAAGTRVIIGDFAIRPMQADLVPPDAVMPADIERALGQSLKMALPVGRPLLWGYLSSGTSPSFSDLLDENRRALTITVDELNSISGMIRPFDRIDLFVIGPDRPGAPGGGKEMKIVRPLLQNVRVKATGNTARRETAADGREYDRRYSTLTLDLLPDEIGKVLIAQENGELKAALKRPEQDDVRYRPTRESDLWAEDGGGAGGGVVFYIGGKGGALQPETLPFAGDSVAGGAASGTGMRLPAGGEMARNALPPREARREEKTDDRGASVPAPSVAASRTTDGTNERAR